MMGLFVYLLTVLRINNIKDGPSWTDAIQIYKLFSYIRCHLSHWGTLWFTGMI